MNQEIEKLKNELEHAVNNPNSNMEDLTKIACNIDSEIEKLYKPKLIKEKIEELLHTEESTKIIIKVKSDLLDHYYNISIIELEILAQNIYDYCCLMVNGFSQQEIIGYITETNAKYYDKLSKEDKNKMTIEANLKFFKYLISKYTKIIESNKQS